MELLDLRKRYAELYKPSTKVPSLVTVPPLRFLMLDGVGGVGGPDFQAAMGTLFGLAYPVKFAAKKQLDVAYQVPPAEGLYWDAQAGSPVPPSSPETTAWRLMIMLPDVVSGEIVDETREKVAAKKDLPRLSEVRVQTFSEGLAVQILHVGPYADETPNVERLHKFAASKGLDVTGAHHEIYLGDPSKTAPEKLRTVLRYGVSQSTRKVSSRPCATSAKRAPKSCCAQRPR